MGWQARTAFDEEDRLDRKAAAQVLRRALRYLRPYRWEMVLGLVVMLGATVCLVAPPLLFGWVVDGVARGLAHPADRRHEAAYIDHIALVLLGLAFGAWFLSRAQILIVTRVGEKFLRDIRRLAFDHLLAMSLGFFDTEQTGRLVSRLTSDIDTMEDLVQQGLVVFVTNGLIFVFTIAVMAIRSWELTLVCLVGAPGVIVASLWFRRMSNRAYLHVRDTVSQTLSSLQEGLTGVRVVQAFTREDHVVHRFGEANRAQRDANISAMKLSCLYFPVVEGSGVITIAVAAGVGGLLVHNGSITAGTVVTFFLWLTGLFEPINQISQLYNLVQQAGAGLHKLYGLLDTPSPVTERAGAVDLPHGGDVELDHVTFSYGPDHPAVVDDVSLTVTAGASGWPSWVGDRRRQVDAGQAGGPLLRPRRRHRALRGDGPARRHAAVAASADRGRAAGGAPVRGDHRRQRAPRQPPGHRRRGGRRPPGAGRLRPVRLAAGRAGHPGERAGIAPVGGRTPAALPRPRLPLRSPRARPRRGHLQPGPRHRGGGRAGGRDLDGRPDRDRRGPPPLDGRAGRPGRGGRCRRRAGGRNPQRTGGARRPVRRAVRLPWVGGLGGLASGTR